MIKNSRIIMFMKIAIIGLFLAVLTGLIVTGALIGWGPFSFIKFNKKPITLSKTQYRIISSSNYEQINEKKIFGTTYLPEDGKEKRGIVILSHGYGGTSAMNQFISKSLAQAGIAVYAFDFPGGSKKSKSDGETTEMSILTQKEDLNEVINIVKSWDWVDEENVILFGDSQGGLVTSLVAVEREDIDSIVLYFPAFSIPDNARDMYESTDDIPDTARFMGMTVGRNYYSDIWDIDVFDLIAGYTGDVLLIHGTEDQVVPYSYSERAVEIFPNAELYRIDGGGHGFYGEKEDEALKQAYQFIKDHMN